MKLHSSVGADILSAIEFPYPVVPIVRHHHESWNGTGYPDGLSGADIPIGARILSVVDCFDALTSDRPYRPKLSDREAISILHERRGTMYDPLVVDAFVRVHQGIASSLAGQPRTSLTAMQTGLGGTSETTSHRLEEIAAGSEEMLTLFDLARGLSNHMSVAEMGDVIAQHLRRLVPFSLCVFYLYNVESDELVAAHATGDNSAAVTGLRIGLGKRLSGWVAANRRTIRNSDPVLDFGDAVRALSSRPRSSLSTPLLSDGVLLGVLSLYGNARDGFSDEHQRIVEVVAKQISTIVQSASALERATSGLLRDQSTELPNGERLQQLTRAGGDAELLSYPVAALVIRIAPKAGGAIGLGSSPQAVRPIVDAVRKTLRSGDLLFRSGEDELVALLVQTDPESSLTIADRVRDALQQVATLFSLAPEFGVSVVVSSLHHDVQSVDTFLKEFTAQRTESSVKDQRDLKPQAESVH